MAREDSPSGAAFSSSAASATPTTRAPDQADGVRLARFSLARQPIAWGVAAVVFLSAGIFGWINAPVRDEPFDDPLPPLSLDWWRYPAPDPGIAELDMVPVGPFGSFLPRQVARNIGVSAPFAVADIADAYVQPDGKQILLGLYSLPGHLTAIYYSADAGETWLPRFFPLFCQLPSNSPKIQGFDQNADHVVIDCFPKAATKSNGVIAGAESIATAVVADAMDDGLWLTTDGKALWVADGGFVPFSLPNKSALTIARPQQNNSVLVASADGFATLPWQQIPRGGPLTTGDQKTASPKSDGFAQTAQQTAPNAQQPTTAAEFRQIGTISGLRWTPIHDPENPDGSHQIRAIRLSDDGKSIVVAQEVARDTGVLVSHDGGQNWSRLAYATGAPPWVVFIAFPLALMAAAGAARQFIHTPPGDPSIADEAATDRPIGLHDADALQFGPIAHGLLMFIRNPQTEPPVTIAITGAWGSGKTSLMNILRDLLRDHDARPVWFNAWHHQKEEHLLAALIENIRQQAVPSIGTWAGLFFRLRLMRRRFVGRLGVMFVLLAFALFIVGSYLSLSEQTTKQLRESLVNTYQTTDEKKSDEKKSEQPSADSVAAKGQKGDLLLALIALLPTGLAIPALAFGILRNLQAFPRAKPEQLLAASSKDKGGFASKLSFRYRFEREFRETAAALRNSASPGLVVFIDDLDRCHSKNVVELLEAINFIVSAGECFIVVGMAKDQIRRSILANYKSEFLDLPEEAVRGGDIPAARRRFADRYLEKLINIEVPVPQASAQQIMSLLSGEAKRPDLPPGVVARRRLRLAYDNGPVILAAGFLVALFIWVHPYLARFSLPAQTLPPVAETPAAPASPAGSAATALAEPQVYASDKDLASAGPRAGFPWSQATLDIAILIAAGAYLTRLWVLAKQRPASDSQPFREALKLWNPVIFLAARTPRAVKQYKNMLRYQAMRLRALQATGDANARIPEADLVALGAISLVDRAFLIGAIPPSGKPISSLVKEAASSAQPGDLDILKQISASLDQRHTIAAPTILESAISQYVALLPPET